MKLPSPGIPITTLLLTLLAGSAPSHTIVINEIMASNGTVIADEDGDFEDWIELLNTGDEGLQLEGFTLSDDMDNPARWQFPPVYLEPGGHLLVWASGKDRAEPGFQLHTNFSISREGEPILLSSPTGELVDIFPATPLPRDISLGRSPDGTGPLRYFATPTPGEANTTTPSDRVLEPPTFSHDGGFHDAPFLLELLHSDEVVEIVYTLDGSLPSPDNLEGTTYHYKMTYPRDPGNPFGELLEREYRSRAYENPITVEDRSEEPDSITGIASTWDRSPNSYAPRTPVFKGTVVRARAFAEGAIPSETVTRTFFVTPEGATRYSLPVLSLAIQENHLFDYENGIHVAGVDFDTWRTNSPQSSIRFSAPANYHRRGRDWEYPTHLEIFSGAGDAVFTQNLGWRIHGGGTRARAQKSFRLYARNAYDPPGSMDFPFFPTLTNRVDGEPIESFQRLILRNSGDDLLHTRMRDAFLHRLLQPLGLDHQAYSPTIKFINGEYWGLINIRERLDRYYIAANHLVDPDDVVMLVNNAEISEGSEADRQEWLDLIAYCEENDLAQQEHFDHVANHIDIDNFILYQMGQIYIKNVDWPGNNNRYWRSSTPRREPGFPTTHDGRWRWILFDLDFGFGRLASWEPPANHAVSLDTLSMAAAEEQERQNPPWSTALFRALLDNEEFRQRFIIAMADHINTTFDPARVERVVDEMHAVIAPYLDEHRHRWRNTMNTSPEFMKIFGTMRPEWVHQHVIDFFELEGTHDLYINITNPDGGNIRVNTVEIPPSEPEWNGVYFLGVPLRVEAIPHYGYTFTGWGGTSPSSGRTVELLPEGNVALTATFEKVGDPSILHYWDFEAPSLLEPTHTSGGATLAINPGGETEITTGSGNGFTASHLRVNNPIGAEILAHLPTTDSRDIRVTYETRRSGRGAGLQTIEYSIDGTTFHHLDHRAIHATDPMLQILDLREIPGVNNNPDFTLRITFGEAMGGTAGNNRFDNFTVEGIPSAAPGRDDLDLWLLK